MLYRLHNPAPGRRVTSPYGMRRHPISGTVKKHRGIDYGGTFPVVSAGDGVVSNIGYTGSKKTGAGHFVIIKHANDCYTAYFHGANATALRKGDRVKAGDFVFTSGSTGASTGPHLHFEVRTRGVWGFDVDPNPYFNASGVADVGINIIPVTGRLDRKTWMAWQQVLRDHGYKGIIDGIPGRMTYSAIQRSVGATVDGIFGPMTRRKVQEHLKKLGYYTMAIDGVWGRGTIAAIQRCLNDGKY